MKSSLRTRLIVAMCVLSVFSTVTATGLTAVLWLRGQRESINEQLQTSAAALLSLGISDFTEWEDFQQLDQFIEDTLQTERLNRIVRLFDSKHNLLFSSVPMPEGSFLLPPGPIQKAHIETVHTKSGNMQSLVLPYEVRGARQINYLQVLMPLPRAMDIIKNLWWEGLALFFAQFLIALLLSRYLARRLLMPVHHIGEFLEDLDPKRIEQWQPMPPQADAYYLRAISHGINRLLERTKSSVLQIKKMSRYVAHEMRTPLTILQGESENVLAQSQAGKAEYEKVLRSGLEEIQKMSEIVSTVLEVGQDPQSLSGLQLQDVDLPVWIAEKLDHWSDLLGRPISWQNSLGEALPLRLDPRLLFRLLDNLVRNVRFHTPRDAACHFLLQKQDGQTVLAVEDEGPGMDALTRHSLNTEGRRSDFAGVGLNLCLTIAENCGWKLSFSPLTPHGLRVRIQFE